MSHVLNSCHCDFTEVSSVTLRYPRRSSGVTCHGDDYKRHNSFVDMFVLAAMLRCWDILLRIILGIFEGLKWKNWLIRAQNQFHVT